MSRSTSLTTARTARLSMPCSNKPSKPKENNMKKILATMAIAMATTSTSAAEKIAVKACPIGQSQGVVRCATYNVDTMPRFEMNAVMISLGGGKFVIYNLAGWSIQISN